MSRTIYTYTQKLGVQRTPLKNGTPQNTRKKWKWRRENVRTPGDGIIPHQLTA
jgi:hypothetical protein